jgi:ornithine carbamoyltransferase
MKDLLRIADLTAADLGLLLDLGDAVHRDPHLHADLFAGETVVTYFAKPSTRTRLSFGSAIAHLGGTPEVVGPTDLQLGRGETIEDTARVISRYAKAFVIRTFADEDVRRFAAAATIPVINGLTDLHHPCQALADLLTLRRHFGTLGGLRLAYLGDGNNVAHSLLEACALAGVHLTVATPARYEPDAAITARARELAAGSGALLLTTNDAHLAVAGVDAIYTDVWVSMGDGEDTRTARREALSDFQVSAEIMRQASPGAVFMHCLPAHRGEEVAAVVIDGPASVVLEEAENRMHTAQALLIALTLGQLEGGATTAMAAIG